MKKYSSNSWNLWVVVGIVLVVFTSVSALAADKFPSKPITLVVPWAPGGRTDLVARTIAPVLEKFLGRPIIVSNKAGASGYIGMKSVSTANPDGYTLGIAGAGLMVLQYTGEGGKIGWEEFKWIGQCYTASASVAVNAESPWNNIQEFVEYGRKNPMKLKHGNGGYNLTTHLFAEGFAKAAGIKITEIVYKGDGPAAVGLASKEVDFVCSPLGPIHPLMEAGKIKVLALQADRRSPQFPSIPTLKEKGIDFSIGTFEGLIAAKDTPDQIVTILESALEKTMKDAGVNEFFKKLISPLASLI